METTHTGLELSRWLDGVGFEKESNHYFIRRFDNSAEEEWCRCSKMEAKFRGECKVIARYDILNDLCVKYGKEIFGKEHVRTEDGRVAHRFYIYTKHVLFLMQIGEKEEAEQYIMKHSILNK